MGTVYNPNIPQPTNLISNSQDDILTNFTQLNTQFAVDHDAFNTGSANGDGKHKQITFPAVTSQGLQTNPASVLYTKSDGTVSQLFYKNQNGDQQLSNGTPLFSQIVFSGTTGAALNTPLNANTLTITGSGSTANTYTFTMPTPPANINFLYQVSFLTGGTGASRVTINTKTSNGLTFQFFNNTNAAVQPVEGCVMIWSL